MSSLSWARKSVLVLSAIAALLLSVAAAPAAAGTADEVGLLPTVDPLNRSESPLSNGGKWTTLNWATNSGQDTTSGWGPASAFPTVTGAYWNVAGVDGRYGDAAALTMQTAPGISERYVSIWLNMPSPGSAKSGYQLRWTTNPETSKYTVKLSKWVSGTETVLASNAAVSIPTGTTLAIADTGGTVSAWRTENGTTFASLLSASDSTYESGYAGLEGAGNISRSVNFKAGPLLGAAAATAPVLDNLERSEVPLATGKWTKTSWAAAIGGTWMGGYRGYGSSGNLAGAYWNGSAFSDAAGGSLVAATVGTGAAPAGQYLALWLDMPEPGSARSGYEARFTGTNGTATAYKVELSKWVAGTRTVLAGKEGFSLPVNTTMALTDSGGGIVLWTGSGGSLAPLLTATDTTYGGGYAGLEVNGGAGTVYNFRAAGLGGTPETTITAGPSGSVQPQNVSFSFSSAPSGASFECALDAGAYSSCTSPKAYPSIAQGPHTFRVRAVNANGADSTPAERSFTVVAPPTVTGKDASAVKDKAATLNASVNPNGAATTYQFEWGTSTAYGNLVPASAKALGSGSAVVEASEPITGLSPNTEYHFRVSATNANGTTKGSDKTFVTADKPSAVTDVATEVSADSAKLTAIVNPNGAATTYQFEWGPTSAYGSKAPASATAAGSGRVEVNLDQLVSGLTEGTEYHFRVVASNEFGTTNGADETFTTGVLPGVTTDPAGGINANEAILMGTVDPNNEPTSYRFEYGTTTGYGTTLPLSEEVEGGDAPVEAEEGVAFLEPETTYHYRLVATSAAGTVAGPDRTVTTSAREATPQQEQELKEKELTGVPVPGDFVNMMWNGEFPRMATKAWMEMIRGSGSDMLRIPVGGRSTQMDETFRLAAQRGITILPGVGGGGTWPQEDGGVRPGWVTSVKTAVEAYGRGGSFWDEHPGLASHAPLWWEIWNEQNYGKNGDHDGIVRPAVFGDLLEESADAIHEVDPGAQILLGGLLAVSQFEAGDPVHKKTVGEFIRQMGHHGSYDAVSIHPYAFKANDGEAPSSTVPAEITQVKNKIRANIQEARAALDDKGGGAKKLWITEIGWPVKDANYNGTNDDDLHLPVNEDTQRDLLNATFNMIKARAGDGPGQYSIRNVFYYNVQDLAYSYERAARQEPGECYIWDCHSGLREDYKPKEGGRYRPAWYALQNQAGFTGTFPKHPKNQHTGRNTKPKRANISTIINPYGSGTNYWVKWGPGTGSTYQNFTDPASVANVEEADVEEQISLTGLQPQTKYHYAVVAENDAGQKTETGDYTFETPPSSSTSNSVRRILHGVNGYVWVEGWVKEGYIDGPGPGLANVHVHVKIFRNGVFQQFVDVTTDSQGHYNSGYIPVGKGTLETRTDFPGGMEWDPSSSDVETFNVRDGVLIRAKHSNNCLDIEGGWFANGVKLMHGGCHGEANQVFSLRPKGEGQYLEVVARHSGKCLDVGNASTADGQQIVQHDCTGGANQAFREEWWGETPYTSYLAQHSNKCLDVANGSTGWAAVQQWTCNSSEQQRFRLEPVESGPIPTETTMGVDQVLHGSPGVISVSGWLKAGPYGMGGRVVQLEFDNASVGGWSTLFSQPITVAGNGSFEYRDYGVSPAHYNIRARFVGGNDFKTSQSAEHFRTVKRGYQIIARHSGRCLSLSENKNVNGQRFLQWDCGAPANGNGQIFSFWEPQGGGWYQLRANGTNRCVDVINVSGANGAGLQLWDCLGGGQTNQHWRREPIQGQSGWYGLMPRHVFPSKCMDVSGAGGGNGALYNQWDCHWGGNQQFELRGVIDP